ncbi:hypothetical protein [Algibacter pacificus]|uniref:hypothetical protein n=1 Tax=Algibacter pacificus TaxID=2599389 RepID=UPI0011CCD671|nr:hypothetical protein [Algibacter pacificus]
MNEINSKEQDEKLTEVLIEEIIKSHFKDGSLTFSDFKNKKIFWNKILELNKKAEYQVIINHTNTLIKNARHFNKIGEYNNAKIFYATYFEHELNRIINELCHRKSIDKKETNNIIKSINIIGKLTWLPLLLGIPKISVKHKNIILKLADNRNAYIHYKHNPETNQLNINQKHKEQEDIKQIEKTITYFKKYTSRVLFNNQKTKLEKELKKKKMNKN